VTPGEDLSVLSSSTPKYQRLTVRDLFGSVTHEIEFSKDSHVTILTGPNGCGKTHVLKLYRALLGLDFRVLMSSPYSSVTVNLVNGCELSAQREEEGDLIILRLRGISVRGDTNSANFSSADIVTEGTEEDLPAHIHQTQDGRWFDARLGRYMSPRIIEQRYRVRVSGETSRTKTISEHSWLADLLPSETPILIDTKRLDTSFYSQSSRSADAPFVVGVREVATRSGAAGRIGEYIEQVRYQITEARRESLQRSQEADEKFAATLLKRSRSTVREKNLKARYQRLAETHAELNESGLTGQAVAVQFPPTTNPTERRILNVFIDDWERKLAPLIPVNEKLKILRRIVNEKFMRKTLAFDARGYMQFISADGVAVSVDQLSSGEQHLLALFTMLLFSAHPGSIVLVDEPEISLHAAWKHAFVEDLEQVAELSELAVVIATHSSAIINGRWELVRELELPD
jgi:ABC-type lipoprotein export system ATPase subunit